MPSAGLRGLRSPTNFCESRLHEVLGALSYSGGFLLGMKRESSEWRLRELEIARLAATQYGVFTRDQAREVGMSDKSIDRRLASQEWKPLYKGVYRTPAVAPSWHQNLMAAFLWAGRDAVVSHRAAAALWELKGIEPGAIEVTVDRARRAPADGVILHRSQKLPACDRTVVGIFHTTSVSRTLIDLSSTLPEEILEEALDDALCRGLTSVRRLRWRIGELAGSGRRGARLFRKLLDSRAPGSRAAESDLETRVFRLLVSSGLPTPTRQYEIRDRGRILLRVDLAYPDHFVAIECDGYRYHSGRKAWQKDLNRRNILATRGWKVLHVTWEDLRLRPREIVQEVRTALKLQSPSNIGG
jgi:very-short-patch-repair endonuclease